MVHSLEIVNKYSAFLCVTKIKFLFFIFRAFKSTVQACVCVSVCIDDMNPSKRDKNEVWFCLICLPNIIVFFE